MRIRRKIAAGLAALVAAATSTLAVASPAKAAFYDCPPAVVCLWQHALFDGTIYFTGGNVAHLGWFNDQASSIWNRSNQWVTIHQHANYQSDLDWYSAAFIFHGFICVTVAPGALVPNLAVGTYFNDQASSVQVGVYGEGCLWRYY
jgi:hypothetical protein